MEFRKIFFLWLLYLFLAFLPINYVGAAENKKNFGNINFREEKIPQIDEGAACVVRECGGGESLFIKDINQTEKKYPLSFWSFLFGSYLFILIFNLSFNLEKKRTIQWLWEAVYTFLAIFVWDKLDPNKMNSWFPSTILISGIIIYGFYFYYLRKKINHRPKEKDYLSNRQEKIL